MENFDDFVRARGDSLLRFAYLLSGDAHRAEDFVQEALIRCHRRWRSIERGGSPEPYVRKAVMRQFLSWRRRKSAGERVSADGIDVAAGTDAAQAFADRDAMWRLLAQLPRRQRAVLVRYFDEPRTEHWLRITVGTKEQMEILLQRLDKILKEA